MPAVPDTAPYPVCTGPMPPRARTGRPAVYCSRACQAKAYRARAAQRRDVGTAEPPRAIRLPKPTGDGSEADRILKLTTALVHRAELAAGAIRHGRPLPDGTDGLDGRPDGIERIAADLVATIRTAATPTPQEPPPLDEPPANPTSPLDEILNTEPDEPERVIRTVDMSADLGDGYALVQLESSFDGEWLVRLQDEIIGRVTRITSLSGHSVTGWEARHHLMKLPYGLRGNWPSLALAAAKVAAAHEQHCLKRRPTSRRRSLARAA